MISFAKIFLALINITGAKAKSENIWMQGDSHSIDMLQLWETGCKSAAHFPPTQRNQTVHLFIQRFSGSTQCYNCLISLLRPMN